MDLRNMLQIHILFESCKFKHLLVVYFSVQKIPPRRAALYLINDLVTGVEFDQCWSAGILRPRNHFELTISLSHREIKRFFLYFKFLWRGRDPRINREVTIKSHKCNLALLTKNSKINVCKSNRFCFVALCCVVLCMCNRFVTVKFVFLYFILYLFNMFDCICVCNCMFV